MVSVFCAIYVLICECGMIVGWRELGYKKDVGFIVSSTLFACDEYSTMIWVVCLEHCFHEEVTLALDLM